MNAKVQRELRLCEPFGLPFNSFGRIRTLYGGNLCGF